LISESCRTDKTCHVTFNNAEELRDGYAEQRNPLYNLYNAISSSYQQENPGLVFAPPDGE
jgi:hypothetical protein